MSSKSGLAGAKRKSNSTSKSNNGHPAKKPKVGGVVNRKGLVADDESPDDSSSDLSNSDTGVDDSSSRHLGSAAQAKKDRKSSKDERTQASGGLAGKPLERGMLHSGSLPSFPILPSFIVPDQTD